MHEIYKGKRVLLTGHTGFKGSWLAYWLQMLGAEVVGYSLAPEELSHFNLLDLQMKNYFEDINNEKALDKAVNETKPDIIFHLAAQALVRDSYDDPVKTYETNVLGSLKVYMAALKNNVPAIVSITTDKVYENKEWSKGYKESDVLGGYDPYSSSKACVELMTDSFRRSFLSKNELYLATARAGNVIGGGDWAKDRLIPDLVRNTAAGKETPIRSPKSVRPWQHVVEPLNGYLMLGQKLLSEDKSVCTSFNFGPDTEDVQTVEQMCLYAKKSWTDIKESIVENNDGKHEAGLLKLDNTKAREILGWSPLMDSEKATDMTIEWYRDYYKNNVISTEKNLKEFEKLIV
ncbi:MAG: CDP-glucose 4,6-dehydratase [Halobacteriovorax sp.]|nr:CDP-glucose 4,6-dehydratase [Halobacteriovorax sp.]